MMSISQVVRDQQNTDEMLRRALERIIQLYTDKAHFIYELLQNAEDSQATVIKFRQMDDCLEVYHDGIPFTSENLNRLCDIGASDKAGNLNQIGEFGVGFKSVFGICDRVRLYSMPSNCLRNTEDFSAFGIEINDFIKPSDISLEPIPKPYTTKFVFSYCVGESFSGFMTFDALRKALADRLSNLGVSTLLFMRHLNCIEYEIDCKDISGSGCYLLEEKKITPLCSIVTAVGATNDNEEELSYLKYSEIIPTMQSAERTVDIAYPVVIEKDGRYRFQKAPNPYISVYFPTETESKISLIVQGPYRTTPNRTSIPFDDDDNVMLAKLTANLLYESILDIKSQGQISLELLNLLPLQEPDFAKNWLFKPLHTATIRLFEKEKVLPAADGIFVTGKCAKIARGQELINLLPGKLLGELINHESDDFEEEYGFDFYDDLTDEEDYPTYIPYRWLPGRLTEDNKELGMLYVFLKNKLKIEVIGQEDLRSYFRNNGDFLKNRDDAWFEQFYKYLEKNSNLVNRSNAGRNMLSIPFVKTADEYLVLPFKRNETSFFPNVFMPTKGIVEGFQFVHPYLAERCSSFFTDVLQLTEPDNYELFKKGLEERYSTRCSEIEATDEEYIEDVKTAIKYLSISKYADDMQQTLYNLHFVRCNSAEGTVYVNGMKSKVYFEKSDEDVSAEDYFAPDEDIWFVDMAFYSENNVDRKSISLLGVTASLIINTYHHGWYPCGETSALWYDVEDFRSHLDFVDIDKVLGFIEANPQSDLAKIKSKIILQLLHFSEKHLSGVIIKGKTRRNREEAYAKIIEVLTSGRRRLYYSYARQPKWLFDKNGKIVNPSEISKYDLDTQIYGKVKRDSSIYDILGFAHTQKDETEEVLANILDRDRQAQDSILDRLLFERFGVQLAEIERLAFAEKYKSSVEGISNEYDADQAFFNPEAESIHDFPSRPVKNLAKLRESVENQYLSAPKVKYEIRPRSIRVSYDEERKRAYLDTMYASDDDHSLYVCQMCIKAFPHFEAVQIKRKPKLELSQMHILLCPYCAEQYRGLRNDSLIIEEFINNLCEADENQGEPICVSVGPKMINFTATHIAEIKEIQRLTALPKGNDKPGMPDNGYPIDATKEMGGD